MMAFIGVRSSWLMLARNALLARLACSASSPWPELPHHPGLGYRADGVLAEVAEAPEVGAVEGIAIGEIVEEKEPFQTAAQGDGHGDHRFRGGKMAGLLVSGKISEVADQIDALLELFGPFGIAPRGLLGREVHTAENLRVVT